MKRIPDVLWKEIEKIIPIKKTKIGRPEKDNKMAFEGVLHILISGSQWKLMPEKFGRPSTVHEKFMKWCRTGIFKRMLIKAREYYRKRNSKNMWFAIDTTLKKAPFAECGGKNPTDRAKRGIKHVIIVDRKGAPIFVDVASANKHDSKLMDNVLNQMRRSKKIRILTADSAFDVSKLREKCKSMNVALIAAVNPRRKPDQHRFSPACRWIVERTFGWLAWYRGLKVCWAKTYEAQLAFLQIACTVRLFQMS
jgi:transposase